MHISGPLSQKKCWRSQAVKHCSPSLSHALTHSHTLTLFLSLSHTLFIENVMLASITTPTQRRMYLSLAVFISLPYICPGCNEYMDSQVKILKQKWMSWNISVTKSDQMLKECERESFNTFWLFCHPTFEEEDWREKTMAKTDFDPSWLSQRYFFLFDTNSPMSKWFNAL